VKVTLEWTKTETYHYKSTIKINGATNLDNWDFEIVAEEIDNDTCDDFELLHSSLISSELDYDADYNSVEAISDDPPVMPKALCTKT
jgi:hypothetical protein